MFNSPFKFRYVHHFPRKDNGLTRKVHLFTCRGKNNNTYCIECEEFECYFVAIKYFQKCDRDKPAKIKFGIMTNLNEATRIIATCVQAMLYLARKHPYYSFGFIGSPSHDNEKDREIANTKRFRVYSYLMINVFSPVTYQHIIDAKKSSYTLINKNLDHATSRKLNDLMDKILTLVPSQQDAPKKTIERNSFK